MAKEEITPAILSNEIDQLNCCVSDWICMAAEELPAESPLHSLGVMLMQHHDIFTKCLQIHLQNPATLITRLSVAG